MDCGTDQLSWAKAEGDSGAMIGGLSKLQKRTASSVRTGVRGSSPESAYKNWDCDPAAGSQLP